MTARTFPLWLALVLSLLAMAIGLHWGVGSEEQWRLAARYTARVGFPLFLITYVASSWARLWPGSRIRAVLRHRRQWGLGFAFTHSVHLAALIMAHVVVGEWPQPVTLAGGGGAYGLLYLMAATSNDASMRKLGIWWKRLHSLGIHWLWFIFAFSYFGRILVPESRAEGLLFFGLALLALGVRGLAWRKRRAA